MADIVVKAGRSHMLAVKGGAWTTLGGGIGTCQGLKPDEGDDVEARGTLDVLGRFVN